MLNQLKGARFSTPASETDDTNAIGRGMMPLIIRRYYADALAVQSGPTRVGPTSFLRHVWSAGTSPRGKACLLTLGPR